MSLVDAIRLLDRYDTQVAKLESDTVIRINNSLDASFRSLEKELRSQYPKIAKLDGLLPSQRKAVLLSELGESLKLISPEKATEYDKILQEVFGLTTQTGVELGSSLAAAVGDRTLDSIVNIPIEAVALQAKNGVLRLQRHDAEFQSKASAAVEQGLIQGWGANRVAGVLRQQLGTTKGQAERIARTEIMSSLNGAAKSQYAENKINYGQWIATGDSRLCPYCSARNGSVYPLDKIVVPSHPSCRCFIMPYDPKWQKAGLTDDRWMRDFYNLGLEELKATGKQPNYGLTPFEKANGLQQPPKPFWQPRQVRITGIPSAIASPVRLRQILLGAGASFALNQIRASNNIDLISLGLDAWELFATGQIDVNNPGTNSISQKISTAYNVAQKVRGILQDENGFSSNVIGLFDIKQRLQGVAIVGLSQNKKSVFLDTVSTAPWNYRPNTRQMLEVETDAVKIAEQIAIAEKLNSVEGSDPELIKKAKTKRKPKAKTELSSDVDRINKNLAEWDAFVGSAVDLDSVPRPKYKRDENGERKLVPLTVDQKIAETSAVTKDIQKTVKTELDNETINSENVIGVFDSKGRLQGVATVTYSIAKESVVIDRITTAPWNHDSKTLELKNVEKQLVDEAIARSAQYGWKGKVTTVPRGDYEEFFLKFGFKKLQEGFKELTLEEGAKPASKPKKTNKAKLAKVEKLPSGSVLSVNSRFTTETFDNTLDLLETPGAKERVQLVRQFISNQGIQIIFDDLDQPFSARRAIAKTTRVKKWIASLGPNDSIGTAKGGFTRNVYNHVVVVVNHPDYENKVSGDYKADAKELNSIAKFAIDQYSEKKTVFNQAFGRAEYANTDTQSFLIAVHELGHQVHYALDEAIDSSSVKPPEGSKAFTVYGTPKLYGNLEWFAEHFSLWLLDAEAYAKADPIGAEYFDNVLKDVASRPRRSLLE